MSNSKHKALKAKSSGKEYSFHDLRSGSHRKVEYSEARSAIKKAYGHNHNRVSSAVRQHLTEKIKPNTSEAIPAHGGYYSRTK